MQVSFVYYVLYMGYQGNFVQSNKADEYELELTANESKEEGIIV